MKITKAETWPVSVRQETPYAVAYGQFHQSTLIFIRIETDIGLVGYGSAGCDTDVTGETPESILQTLTDTAMPMLQGHNPFLHVSILHDLFRQIGNSPSALAAVDMALFDIIGKRFDLALWKILGGFRDRIPTSITIGILPELETLTSARNWVAQGFRSLKIKGGLDVDSDIERVKRIRESVGASIEIRFDANQGYTVPQVLRFAKETQIANVVFIEQPTPANNPELLGEVRKARIIPIMADECLKNAKDVYSLASRGLVDLMNIKLMKSGGIHEALQMEAVARAAGIGIMVGCMDESALSIAAGLHFALACPAVKYADLDGHIGLIGDPVKHGLKLENGVLFPPDRPGLGVEPA